MPPLPTAQYAHLLARTCNSPTDNFANSSCIHGTCNNNNVCVCDNGWTNDVTITRINSCSVPEHAIEAASWVALIWGIINILLLILQRLTMLQRKQTKTGMRSRPPISKIEILLLIGSLAVCGMGLAVIVSGYSNEWYWGMCIFAVFAIQSSYMLFCHSFLTVTHQLSGTGRKLNIVKLRALLLISTICIIAPFVFGMFIASVMYPLSAGSDAAEKFSFITIVSYGLVPFNIVFNSPISIIYAYRIYVLATSASSQNEQLRSVARRLRIFIMFLSGVATPGILISCEIMVILYFTHTPYVWGVWVVLMASLQYVITIFILSGWQGGSRHEMVMWFCDCGGNGGSGDGKDGRIMSSRLRAIRRGFGARGGRASGPMAAAEMSSFVQDSGAMFRKSGVTVTSTGGGQDMPSVGPDF